VTGSLGGGGRPPRLAEALLRLVISDPESREGILGDLFEEYCEAAATCSRRYATRWYWWSALRLAVRYASARIDRLPRRVRGGSVLAALDRGGPAAAIVRDAGYAARSLRRSPGFTAALSLVLGLGIGASTTIFGVFDTVVLEPIPFPEPDRLVSLGQLAPQGMLFLVSRPDYLDYRQRAAGLVDLAAFGSSEVTYRGEEDVEHLSAGLATSALFGVLGVAPVAGRGFSLTEVQAGAMSRSVILSSRLWASRFDSDPEVVGRSLRLDDGLYVVIGVMPEALDVLLDVDVWLPLGTEPGGMRDDRRLQVFGRLRPDVELDAAREELGRIAASLSETYPATNQGWGTRLTPLAEVIVGPQVKLITVTLLSAMGLFLLLIGANISNLLLARTTTRQKEFGVRSALGGGRWGVVRLLMAESLVLGCLGAAVGMALAYAIMPVVALQPELVPRMSQVVFDGRVLAFGILASAAEGIGIGLGSTIQATRWNVRRTLTETGGGTARTARRYRDVLVVGQVALAMTLLVVAGLLAKSFQRLQRVERGFGADGLFTVEVQLSPTVDRGELPSRVEAILSALGGIAGVRTVAGTSMRYFDMGPRLFTEFGRTDMAADDYVTADWRIVTDGYFRTAEIPTYAGQVFDDVPAAEGESTVVIGQALARRLWGEEEAVGREMRWDGPEGRVSRVIGVVGDVSDVHPGLPQVASAYVRYADSPLRSFTVLLRSDPPPPELRVALRRAVAGADGGAVVGEIRAVVDQYSDVVALDRFLPAFLSVVAVIAVILAAVGIYGLVSFTVARRGHEIGIRLALGGLPDSMVRMLVGHGLILVGVGVLVGGVTALALSRILAELLFQTEPSDPATYAAVGGFLAVVGIVATYVPSRRASRVDPGKVLPA